MLTKFLVLTPFLDASVLAFLGAVIAALLGLCGVLYSQLAPRQKIINDAMDSLMAEVQRDRAVWIARCSELERIAKHNRGEIRNLKQYIQSLLNLLKREGIDGVQRIPLPKNYDYIYQITEDADDVDISPDEW